MEVRCPFVPSLQTGYIRTRGSYRGKGMPVTCEDAVEKGWCCAAGQMWSALLAGIGAQSIAAPNSAFNSTPSGKLGNVLRAGCSPRVTRARMQRHAVSFGRKLEYGCSGESGAHLRGPRRKATFWVKRLLQTNTLGSSLTCYRTMKSTCVVLRCGCRWPAFGRYRPEMTTSRF